MSEYVVRVTAADWNGKSFDGLPFDKVPKWLKTAIDDGLITIEPANLDYALWRVRTADGEVIAEPGDHIFYEWGALRVQTAAPHKDGMAATPTSGGDDE